MAVGKHSSASAFTSVNLDSLLAAIVEVDFRSNVLIASANYSRRHPPCEKVFSRWHITGYPFLYSKKKWQFAVWRVRQGDFVHV
jgi:hypothetical protein